MANRRADKLSAVKGGCPVNNSNRTTPRENTSDRPSTFLPAICSGDMYVGVPRTTSVWVLLLEAILAMPKSITFTNRSFVIMMLAGLMSRCMTPC